MDDNKHGTLQSLQGALKAVTPANSQIKEQIEYLDDSINQYISVPDTSRLDRLPALQKALQDAIETFEGDHPNLTEALRIAINTLVNAGI
jgi:hypothetical protein